MFVGCVVVELLLCMALYLFDGCLRFYCVFDLVCFNVLVWLFLVFIVLLGCFVLMFAWYLISGIVVYLFNTG